MACYEYRSQVLKIMNGIHKSLSVNDQRTTVNVAGGNLCVFS